LKLLQVLADKEDKTSLETDRLRRQTMEAEAQVATL